MKITSKSLPANRKQFTTELTDKEVNDFFEHALQHLAKTVKLPGFRPGKAPDNLVKEQIDPNKLREEAYNLAVREAWRQISDQLSAESRELKAGSWHGVPIQDPEVTLEEFEEGKMAKITFEFDVRPEVKLDPKWEKISIKSDEKSIVSDEEVELVVKSLKQGHAQTIIKLEPAKKGDRVEVDFQGSVDGVTQDNLKAKKFPVLLGESSTIPGFDDHLIGLKKGEKKTFKLKFPEDHFDKTLAKKEVEFTVDIQEVFEVILPELNQEFSEKFGHTKPEQLLAAIKENLVEKKDDDAFVTQKAKWLSEFEKLVKVDVPQSLIDAEVERSKEAWVQFLQQRNLSQDNWLKERAISMDQLMKDWSVAAEKSVKIGLGLAEVAKAKKQNMDSNEDFQKLLDSLVKDSIKN